MSSSEGRSVDEGSKNNDDCHHAAAVAVRGTSGEATVWDRRFRVVSCVSFFLGCAWVLLFPLVTVTTGEAKPRGTFFDENAMLVHHTTTKLTAADVDWARPGPLSKAYPQDGAVGAAWVCAVLRGMDLPCYTHTFYQRPAERAGLRTSVYTVLEPAPGSDGKECMVLTTSQNLSGAAEDMLARPAFAGLSLSLSVLKQLNGHVGWMSKRLIVLFVDEDLQGDAGAERLDVGIKTFVDDYHVDTLDLLDRHAEDSNMTSSIRHVGMMRAAISLDFPEFGEPEVVQLLTSGINGELPNMDLLNAAVFHLERQGVGVLLDTCSASLDGAPFSCQDATAQLSRVFERHLPRGPRRATVKQYLDRLFSMLGFMGSAAMGPSGPHAHFLRHSVDALTIRGLGKADRDSNSEGQGPVSETAVRSTAAVLSIVRAVSNLEEELHHSFFSYLMLSKKAFVSIGEYAYALVLLLVPLALQGRRLTALNEDKKLLSAVLIVGTFEAFGALLLWIASAWPEPSEDALAVFLNVADVAGYLLILAVSMCVPKQAVRRQGRPFWEGPKTVMACLVAYSCSVTALLSWQVAAVLALTHVPLLSIVRPFRAKSWYSWCMALAMFVSSPARWSPILGLVTAQASGTGVVLQWLRWFRLSGLLNVPLMCLVAMPAHLTVAFVLFAPQPQRKV